MWANVWAVIRREYLQRVRSKWFVIATVGGPLLMIALTVLPVYLMARGQESDRVLAVVDATDVLYERVAPRLERAGYTVQREARRPDVTVKLRQKAVDGEIGGFLVLDELTLETGEATLFANDPPSAIRRLALQEAVTRSALEYLLEAQGVDARSLLSGENLKVERLTTEGADEDDPRFLVAYLGAFLLYMVILLYAIAVMRATLEEKTNRVVEIIISAMDPWHLMLGKIIGVGAVGLTQIAVWIGTAVLLAAVGLPALVAARPEVAELQNIREALPGMGMAVLFFGFFVFGYFMYSGLYAAVGAMCSTEEEAQQAQFPVVMFLVVPIVFVMQVIQDPMTPLSTGLSLFPLFSPILMWGRVAGGGVPVWQIALSFALMALALLVIAWLAGRIYKVGILMTGKRPTLPELWRWVREA